MKIYAVKVQQQDDGHTCQTFVFCAWLSYNKYKTNDQTLAILIKISD